MSPVFIQQGFSGVAGQSGAEGTAGSTVSYSIQPHHVSPPQCNGEVLHGCLSPNLCLAGRGDDVKCKQAGDRIYNGYFIHSIFLIKDDDMLLEYSYS